MSEINNGGPAFPTTQANGYGGFSQGMTLRDFIAAHALAGMFSNQYQDQYTAEQKAFRAYEAADAMLAAREPVPTEQQP